MCVYRFCPVSAGAVQFRRRARPRGLRAADSIPAAGARARANTPPTHTHRACARLETSSPSYIGRVGVGGGEEERGGKEGLREECLRPVTRPVGALAGLPVLLCMSLPFPLPITLHLSPPSLPPSCPLPLHLAISLLPSRFLSLYTHAHVSTWVLCSCT